MTLPDTSFVCKNIDRSQPVETPDAYSLQPVVEEELTL